MKRIVFSSLLCLILSFSITVSAQEESCRRMDSILNAPGPVVVRLLHLEPNPITIGEKAEVVLMLYNWLPEPVVAEYVIEVLDHGRRFVGEVARQQVQLGGHEVRSVLYSRVPTEGAQPFNGFIAVQVRLDGVCNYYAELPLVVEGESSGLPRVAPFFSPF